MLAFPTRTLKAVALTLGLALPAMSSMAVEWRGWNIHVQDYPVSIAMDSFIRDVAEKTGGKVSGKVFHNGVLGNQPDAIEQVRLGVINFGEFSLGPMGQSVPEANVVSLPFIFKSIPQMYRLMDGEVGEAIGKGMMARGLVPVGWYDAGARSFYNAIKPINTPDDLRGMKVRVMNNDLFVSMIASMGGNATPMALAEVFQSIKNRVVDGAENNPPAYESTNHYEVAKFYSLTEHLIIPECLCVSKASWDKLTPDQQAIVKAAGKRSADLQRKLWAEREKASMEKVKAAGVKVNTVADKKPFQDAMKPVHDKFLAANPGLAGLVNMMREAN